jgi:hypothetical protein
MKFKLAALLYFFPLFCLFAGGTVGYEIEPGKYHILAHRVNIRSQPNLNGEIIGKLELNDEVEVIENMFNEQKIDNVVQYWYKIRFKEIEGYVWGGYIAIDSLVCDIDNNGTDDYFYSRIKGMSYTSYKKDSPSWEAEIALDDIFIYINNKRISTELLENYFMEDGRNWERCWFRNGEKKVIMVINTASHRELYFDIYSSGRIQFIRTIE